jgi:hypothetical protein
MFNKHRFNLHIHCWHKLIGSERKIKRKTRCHKRVVYSKNKKIQVQADFDCCICSKHKTSVYEENEDIASKYPDSISNNIYMDINNAIIVRCFKPLMTPLYKQDTIDIGHDAPFSFVAIQICVEQVQTGKQQFNFMTGLEMPNVITL